ncbi:MAG: inositol monophosphatase [Candidatus Omnitrophica bacterium]|nr:inositol monophosphatase [Candidatus Omnitrophota bacterium]MBI3083956.1 inositol monophosphatase [Candidatus Omnitrophota bacterium]
MSPQALTRYAEAAVRAALAAGSLLAKYVGRPRTVGTKRSPIDLVTEVDRAAERLIYRILHRAAPDVGFLGEESGEHGEEAPSRWVVDPLDGTNNFVHGLPLFGVSIGLEHRRMIVVGVIYDPMRRELFVALKGQGAFLNRHPIRVSPTRRLSHSLLSTGFSFHSLTHTQPYLRWFQTLQQRSHGVRRIGTSVLSLAAVAAGRLEGFYERDLQPWDLAAGALLVEEAGGRITNLEGRPVVLGEGRLIASNGHIHRELLQVLAQPRHK